MPSHITVYAVSMTEVQFLRMGVTQIDYRSDVNGFALPLLLHLPKCCSSHIASKCFVHVISCHVVCHACSLMCFETNSCLELHVVCNVNVKHFKWFIFCFSGAMDSANSLKQAQWVSDVLFIFLPHHIKKFSQRRLQISSWLICPWVKWINY